MKKYSIFWPPFPRQLGAGERLSRFFLLKGDFPSLPLNSRRTGEGRREESTVRCSVRWHVAVVRVHRPLSDIHEEKNGPDRQSLEFQFSSSDSQFKFQKHVDISKRFHQSGTASLHSTSQLKIHLLMCGELVPSFYFWDVAV